MLTMLMSILKIAKNLNKILPQPGFEYVFYFIYLFHINGEIISL